MNPAIIGVRGAASLAAAVVLFSIGAVAQAAGELSEAVERMLDQEGEGRGEITCEALGSGALQDVFGDGAGAAELRPGSKYVPHGLCTATWDKPDAEALQAASTQYEMNRMMAKATGKPFEEPEPPSSRFTVSLTLINQAFDSSEAAIASLEDAVQRLTEGVTVEVRGKEHTTQVDFDDWIDGLGDRAIWAPKASELSVADSGYRYAISVTGYAEGDDNRERAEQLARRLIEDR